MLRGSDCFGAVFNAYFSHSEPGNYLLRGNIWGIKDNGEGKLMMCKAKSLVERMLDLIDEFEVEHDQFWKDLRQVDLEEQDILHDIEFCTFNACEGYFYAKKIKDIRLKRRDIKEYQGKYQLIQNLLKNTNLKNELGKIKNTISLKDSREKTVKYVAKVRTDLKLVAQK